MVDMIVTTKNSVKLPAHNNKLQAHRGVIATGIQQGAAPQLAALPSGLTGHLVQIGQQTYLVPQLLNVRQPGAPQLTISQLVGAAPGQTVVTCATTGTTAAGDGGGGVSDVSSGFQQTQVDGGHDSDDEKFGETPGSQQQTPSASVQVRSVLPQSVQPSDIDDDDDDDDDDDLVPATPGFTPSSVRSNHRYQLHRPGHGGVTPMTDQTHRDHLTRGTPMNMSGPPTPMTPPSVASRATAADGGTSSWRRPHPGQILPGSSAAGSTGRKRRHRSPYHVGDTDTEVDDEFDEDGEEVGDDVELMTNATMTPAGQAGDPEDEDDEKMDADRSQKNKRSGAVARAPPRPKASRTQRALDADRSVSSSVSHPDDIPDAGAPSRPSAGDAASDSMLPPDESTGLDEEEEQEEEEEPLNSGDNVSDEEPEVLFESDNVVVCQYDKIHHSRNRWRLHLKDGIMAINGRDLVFQKAIGEAEW
ncbi:Transcription initiation factor TFIIA large subunit [Fasciola hepatica]|uniref:Transcription initiation factor TFIIA large subunit n=1 Tax=Fasciola hepatica TaxID=6192 RepID=A0A4E0RIT0_FASHE|nr:Transcription initiation factor TFIIA large subunit [Fasciola hepatica]